MYGFSNTYSRESNLINKIIYKSRSEMNMCRLVLMIVLMNCFPCSFIFRIIILGYKKPLEREDLFELNESDSSYTVCPIFEKQWRKEVLRTQEKQKEKVIIKSLVLNCITCSKYEILLLI